MSSWRSSITRTPRANRRLELTRGPSGRGGSTLASSVAAFLSLFLAAPPATAAVQTYSSAPAAAIPEALPPGPGTPQSVTDAIVVPDSGTINDVDVTVTLRHPEHGDLSLALTDPSGTLTVTLINTEGGPGDGLTNVTFDDESATTPPGFVVNGTCLVDETYRPDPGSLSAFDGLDVHGTWLLTVSDNFVGDAVDCDCDGFVVGPACPRTLDEWSLTFDFEGEAGEPVLGCREIVLLIALILLMLAILWLLVSRTRP